MANAIQEGKLLNDHTERPFIEDLARYLSEKGYNQKEYSWIITPHAYHLDECSNKIINQYPIGTSSLMAAFPKAQRQFLFPVIVVFLIYALTLLVSFKQGKDIRSKQFTLTSLFILISIISAPFLTEYININSVAPTFGLLLLGVLIQKTSRTLTLTPSIRTFLSGATIVVLLIVLFSNISKFQDLQKLPQNTETSKLQNCFEGYDVVWGELKTGTIEYATTTPSMRFNWGSKTVRDDIIMWLKNNGYKQVIFLNDLELNENELQRLKNKFNPSVNENYFVNCGLLLEL
tara:strand:+ start:6270 stop:7136 length:867 start_codon:yes stop_codon:yes gene_type:complete